LNTKVSQGNVAMHVRCGGIFDDQIVAQSLLGLTVKNFLKSFNIGQSYGQEQNVLFF